MSKLDVRTIWEIDRNWLGKNCATGGEVHPDMVRFKGFWYVGFKETGRSRLIRSKDGENWETVRVFEWDGAFVGRPYLSIAPEGALMVNTWVLLLNEEANTVKRRTEKTLASDSRNPVQRTWVTWLSLDGVHWAPAAGHLTALGFSVTWHNGLCYGVDLNGALHFSPDGKNWSRLQEHIWADREAVVSHDPNDLGTKPGTRKTASNETALYFHPDDTLLALARTNPVGVLLGQANPPAYGDWTWSEVQVDWNNDGELRPAREVIGAQLGCPVVKRLSDGRIFGIGRGDASDENTNRSRVLLFWVDPERSVLTVFKRIEGYGGYSGVVEHEGHLWVVCSCNTFPSYFVYLIKLPIPES